MGLLTGLLLGCNGSIGGLSSDEDPRGGYATESGDSPIEGSFGADGSVPDPGNNSGDPPSGDPPDFGDLPTTSKKFLASRTSCMAPCAVHFDAQSIEGLTWEQVRDSRFVWDFGGGGAGSEGFLAAHVFDSAGTYYVSLIVDGELWTQTTIDVSAPARSICVSATSSFGDCPSSSSSDHFTSLSAAAGQNHRNVHVLLHRGESFGSIDNFKNQGPTLYGAYGSGAKPKLTQNAEETMGTDVVWQDLDITATRVLNLADWSVLHRVDASGTIGGDPQYWIIAHYVNDFFVVDSDATISDQSSNGAGVYVFQSQRSVVKGNSLYYQQGGTGHAFRANGADRFLIQDNVIDDNGSADILTIRGDNESASPNTAGNAYWTLIQGNEFRGNLVEYKTQFPAANELVQYVVHENNVHTTGAPLILATVHDAVVRGNAFLGMQDNGVSVEDKSDHYDPANIEIYDNTVN